MMLSFSLSHLQNHIPSNSKVAPPPPHNITISEWCLAKHGVLTRSWIPECRDNKLIFPLYTLSFVDTTKDQEHVRIQLLLNFYSTTKAIRQYVWSLLVKRLDSIETMVVKLRVPIQRTSRVSTSACIECRWGDIPLRLLGTNLLPTVHRFFFIFCLKAFKPM